MVCVGRDLVGMIRLVLAQTGATIVPFENQRLVAICWDIESESGSRRYNVRIPLMREVGGLARAINSFDTLRVRVIQASKLNKLQSSGCS